MIFCSNCKWAPAMPEVGNGKPYSGKCSQGFDVSYRNIIRDLRRKPKYRLVSFGSTCHLRKSKLSEFTRFDRLLADDSYLFGEGSKSRKD